MNTGMTWSILSDFKIKILRFVKRGVDINNTTSQTGIFVVLQEMDNIHQHYENLKASTLSLTSAQQDPSVSLIRKNLVPQLRSAVVDFYNWQKRKV